MIPTAFAPIVHNISSVKTGKPYRLFVRLPANYSVADTTRYPVLYVLDGNDRFGEVLNIQSELSSLAAVRDLIIVGVGYPLAPNETPTLRRWRDLTPSHDAAADAEWTTKYHNELNGERLQSGGAAQFLEALKAELIPSIESAYRTSKERALWGHSFGGLFAVYAMLTEPSLFSRIGASSPSLWWHGDEIFGMEAAFAKKHPALSARAYMTVGKEEEPEMIDGVLRFSKAIGEHHYTGLSFNAIGYPGDHRTVVSEALREGLFQLFR